MNSFNRISTSSKPLIEKERLIEIVENAKKNQTPYELLGYLWELADSDPEFGDPPMVRSLDALTEVLKRFWEENLRYELLVDLLCLEEGEDLYHKLHEPQPQQELEDPRNLYQLVRKAWDQGRMGELIAMVEEYENLVYGGSIHDAIMESTDQQNQTRKQQMWNE